MPIDACLHGPLTTERMRDLLACVYDRLLVDIDEHRPVGSDEDTKLMEGLLNCYLEDGKTDEEGRRPSVRLTLRERLIRLAHAAWRRLDDRRPADLSRDLPLLDALQDVASERDSFDWTIDRDCQLQFE